jgi:prevent-host-death family protein
MLAGHRTRVYSTLGPSPPKLTNLLSQSDNDSMAMVNVHEAKTHLSALLQRVEAGEEIVIARAGEPVAKLVPIHKPLPRVPGRWKGKIEVPDSFFDPLPEDIMRYFEGRGDGEDQTTENGGPPTPPGGDKK